jgi:hypothetical protein
MEHPDDEERLKEDDARRLVKLHHGRLLNMLEHSEESCYDIYPRPRSGDMYKPLSLPGKHDDWVCTERLREDVLRLVSELFPRDPRWVVELAQDEWGKTVVRIHRTS